MHVKHWNVYLLRCGCALLALSCLVVLATTAGAEGNEYEYLSVRANAEDTAIDFGDDQITDLDALMAFLDHLPALTKADMYGSSFTADQLETLSSRYPNITFGWTLTFGEHSVRTDATAFSTLHNKKSEGHTTEEVSVLKYCKSLLALDLGHNAITDISFLKYLPNLRILILARNNLKDISPIGELKDLEYLELFSAKLTDVTALSHCIKLLDLNISNNRIKDLSPVLSLPHLERLWLCGSVNGILNKNCFTDDEKEEIKASVNPGCTVNFTGAGTQAGWRKHARYDVLYEIFQTGVYRAW